MSKKFIYILSSILVITVLLTIFLPPIEVNNFPLLEKLPMLNAILNGLSFVSLLTSLYFIKRNDKKRHVLFVGLALMFTLLFLISYLLYHFTHTPTKFGGTGIIKITYIFILATHIVLAAIMLPLIMFTLKEAINQNFEKHKKIARWTMPIWLYVSITGVLVYLLNSSYY